MVNESRKEDFKLIKILVLLIVFSRQFFKSLVGYIMILDNLSVEIWPLHL